MTPHIVPFVSLVYLVLCLLAGFFGRGTRIGYWGTVVVSIVVTPLVVLIGIILFGGSRRNQV